ncbi:MAG: hypothetical protein JWN41_227 [Thermoleophilia bacterium]|nr:hypothetical protein [Thermoleophilia bacterium]
MFANMLPIAVAGGEVVTSYIGVPNPAHRIAQTIALDVDATCRLISSEPSK